MKTKNSSSLYGFTLLEILIALMMTATIMGAMFSVFISSLDVAQSVENSARVDQMMRMVMDRISRDLQSFVPLTASDMRSVGQEENGTVLDNATVDNGTPTSVSVPGFTGYEVDGMDDEDEGIVLMSFPSMASLELGTVFPTLRMNLIRYVLRPQSDESGTFVLYRQELPFAGLYSGQTAGEIELADGIIWQDDSPPQYSDETGDMVSTWDASQMAEEGKPVVPRLITWMLTVRYGQGSIKTYALVVHPLVRGPKE